MINEREMIMNIFLRQGFTETSQEKSEIIKSCFQEIEKTLELISNESKTSFTYLTSKTVETSESFKSSFT